MITFGACGGGGGGGGGVRTHPVNLPGYGPENCQNYTFAHCLFTEESRLYETHITYDYR